MVTMASPLFLRCPLTSSLATQRSFADPIPPDAKCVRGKCRLFVFIEKIRGMFSIVIFDNNLNKKCCPDPFSRLTVTPEGYASVCVVDYKNYLTVADLNKSTLVEAWNSDLFVKLRKRHLENKLDGLICKNCLYNSNEPFYPLMPSLSRACQ